VNMLTLKWAEFLTAWALADRSERKEFQKRHGLMMEPPRLQKIVDMTQDQKLGRAPLSHDAHGPLYLDDVDIEVLHQGRILRRKA
jgi:hypothetical protein